MLQMLLLAAEGLMSVQQQQQHGLRRRCRAVSGLLQQQQA
jgi:hypothetical protein